MKDYVYWGTEKSKCSLKHYGVKGMRWGVRHTPEKLGNRKKSKGTPSHNTVLNTLDDILKKKPKLVKKAMLDEAMLYWDAGDIDVTSPLDGRVFDFRDAYRSLNKRGITRNNTPKQEYYKLVDSESRKLIEKMVDSDVKKLQKNPDDRKKYSKYFMTRMENVPDLRNELYSQLRSQGYHAITNKFNPNS